MASIALTKSAPYLLYEYQQFAKQNGPNRISKFPLRKPLLDIFYDEETVHRVSREYDCLNEDQYSKPLIEGCWSAFLQKDQEEMLSRLKSGKSPKNQRLDYILYAGKKIKNARDTYQLFSCELTKNLGYPQIFSGGLEMMKACCIAFCFSTYRQRRKAPGFSRGDIRRKFNLFYN